MANTKSQISVSDSERKEQYTLGYLPQTIQQFQKRTAAKEAGFLLPHLSPGMRLLDCGCGPGSITVGLAEAVAPGQVVGVDIEPSEYKHLRGHKRLNAQGLISTLQMPMPIVSPLLPTHSMQRFYTMC